MSDPLDAIPSRLIDAIDRVIAIQRPAVLLHIRSIRSRRPGATPDEVIRTLELRYLAAVTTGGAAVGVTAMVPAIGTGTALVISGVETVGFLEATALFAQSITEVHGIALEDPERARALVLAMLAGGPGQDLVKEFANQASGGRPRTSFWGEQITRKLPRVVVMQLSDRIRKVYLPRMLVRETGGVIGRILPFGIGAVVGGVGNQMLGRTIIGSSRTAFGPAPAQFPENLTVTVRSRRSANDGASPGQAERLRRALRLNRAGIPAPPAAGTLRDGHAPE